MNIYVKNLPLTVSNDDLRKYFEPFGRVETVEIITNIRTGDPKDYGFVVMHSEDEAVRAIEGLNGKEWMGKKLFLEKGRNRKRGNARKSFRTA